MSYEDTKCPCGGKKERQTMLCSECVAAFNDRRELTEYQDGTLPLGYRRNAALILIALSKKRKRQTTLALQYRL